MLYLTESDVRKFLPMAECIRLMRAAFERLAKGESLNQPRRRLTLMTKSTLHYMAAGDGKYFGAKIYSTNPRHGARFLFLLYRAEDAALLALMEANWLGQIRTGAASGLATSLLARKGSRSVGIIGSGFQARSQLEAMHAVLPEARVKVWSRSAEKRAAFAAEARQSGAEVEAVETAREAVEGSDVVVTATNSAEPVLENGWIAAGTHINAMGSNQPRRREIPAELVRRADLIVVDSREQARMESGDLILAYEHAEWLHVTELMKVASGETGRSRDTDITLFESNGIALEDVAAAGYVYEKAIEAGAGTVYS